MQKKIEGNFNYFTRKKEDFFFLHKSSSYAKILRETNFQPRELPQSGSKAKDGEKKKEEREKD